MSHLYNNFMPLSPYGERSEPLRHRRFLPIQRLETSGVAFTSKHEKTLPFW